MLKINLIQLVKYGTVTVVGYLILFLGSFILVEKFGLSSSISYFIFSFLVYIGVYISYTKFVFRVEFSKERSVKFIIVIIGQWLFNNLFFNFMTKVLGIYYLIVILINVIVFGMVRFMLHRYVVFKE
jgi:putative flippase GtrA